MRGLAVFARRVAWAALAGWLLAAGAQACPALARTGQPMRTLTQADQGQTVELRLHEALRIVLPENASTGYRWVIEKAEAGLVEALDSEGSFLAPPTDALGSSGEVVLVFRASKVGRGQLVLKYARPWEAETPVARFVLPLWVKP